MTTPSVSKTRVESLQIMAQRLRRHSLLSTTESNSGHPSFSQTPLLIEISLYGKSLQMTKNEDKSHTTCVTLPEVHAKGA